MYNLNDDVLFMNLLVKINSQGSYHINPKLYFMHYSSHFFTTLLRLDMVKIFGV